MARIVKYQPEQIERAQQRLRALPVKDLGKTKEQTADMLAKDVQAILKKGYSLKEACAMLREEGLVLPVQLLEAVVAAQNDEDLGKTRKKNSVKPKEKPEPEGVGDGADMGAGVSEV